MPTKFELIQKRWQTVHFYCITSCSVCILGRENRCKGSILDCLLLPIKNDYRPIYGFNRGLQSCCFASCYKIVQFKSYFCIMLLEHVSTKCLIYMAYIVFGTTMQCHILCIREHNKTQVCNVMFSLLHLDIYIPFVVLNSCLVFSVFDVEELGESGSSHGWDHPERLQHQGYSSHRPLDSWREIQGLQMLFSGHYSTQ